MKIPKFTFEDWEKDTIPKPEFKVPTEMDLSILLEEANMLGSLTDEDFSKIQECQIRTYDMAVEMFFEAKKQRYLINCKRITDIQLLETFKNQEYKWVEKDIEKDEGFIQVVTVGYKHTNSIAGGTFKKVEAKYLQWKGGKYNSIEVNDLKESLTFPLSANLKYSYWLKDQNVSEQLAKKKRGGQELTYIELFKPDYKSDEKQKKLFDILRTNGYIDNSDEWDRKKEPRQFAALYHCLKEKAFIPEIKVAPSIPIFGQRFNLTFGSDGKDFCVIRSITADPGFTKTRKEFDRILSDWKGK